MSNSKPALLDEGAIYYPQPIPFFQAPRRYDEMLENLAHQTRIRNLAFWGPSGSGKTTVAHQLAYDLGLLFCEISLKHVPDFDMLFSQVGLQDGSTVNQGRMLMEGLQSPALVFLDEFTGLQPHDQRGILSAADDRRFIDIISTGQKIPLHPKCRLIIAGNKGYFGTNPVDQAVTSRFVSFTFDYLPENKEIELLSKQYPEVAKSTIKSMVKVASLTRQEQRKSNGLLFDFDVRYLQKWIESALNSMSGNVDEALKNTLEELDPQIVLTVSNLYRVNTKPEDRIIKLA